MYYACPLGFFAASAGSSQCSVVGAGSYVPLPVSFAYLPCSVALLSGAAVCNFGKSKIDSCATFNVFAIARNIDQGWSNSMGSLYCVYSKAVGGGCTPGFYYTGSACAAVPAGTALRYLKLTRSPVAQGYNLTKTTFN